MFCFSLWVGFDALNISGPGSILFSEGKNVVCLRSLHSHCCCVQSLSPVWLFVMGCSTLGFPVLHCLPEFVQTHVHWWWIVMLSNHFILCRPLLLLPSIFSSIRVFYSESAFHIRWPKYWSFSFSISPLLYNIVLYSIRLYFHHQHNHSCASFLLWPNLLILYGAISPLFPSSILDIFWPGELLFWCHIFLSFYTVHGVLEARILEWFVIPSSSGHVRTLYYDLSILGDPAQHGSSLHWVTQAPLPLQGCDPASGNGCCLLFFSFAP